MITSEGTELRRQLRTGGAFFLAVAASFFFQVSSRLLFFLLQSAILGKNDETGYA